VIVATQDEELNEVLAKKAKRYNVLVSVVDNALLSDFNSPATFTIGDIRIGICTGGKSPAMSKLLRKRFEKLITEEDILQVKLQHYVRDFLKEKILDKKKHKNIIYQIINDQKIGNLLKKGNLEESKNLAKRIIKNHMIK
jgi:precorrin-2 dehydrogenase/sirohydrochlorin ferrochelatase